MIKYFLSFFLLTTLLSLKTFAFQAINQQGPQDLQTIDWSDLEISQKYILQQPICFNEQTCLNENQSFTLDDILAGMDILVGFKFHPDQCLFPDFTSADGILVEPTNSDHQRDRSVIVQINQGCDLTVLVEPQDYYSTSFLSETTNPGLN